MSTATPPPLTAATALRDLHPASFALVMATGIISIAAHLLGNERLAQAGFVANVAFYVALIERT